MPRNPSSNCVTKYSSCTGWELAARPHVSFTQQPASHGKPAWVPDRLPRLDVERALAVVELPLHLNWSAPGRVFDLGSRADRARVRDRPAGRTARRHPGLHRWRAACRPVGRPGAPAGGQVRVEPYSPGRRPGGGLMASGDGVDASPELTAFQLEVARLRVPDRVTVSKKSQASRGLGLGAQEIGPCGGTALGCRVDPGIVQDLPDGGSGDLHPEHQQLAVHPAIPPSWVVADQPQYQGADRAHGARSARSPARDQIAVPAHHGIRAHHQVQSLEHVPREPVQQRRQQRPVPGANRTLSGPSCRCRTGSWWRSARISASLSWLLIGSSRSSANTFATLR